MKLEERLNEIIEERDSQIEELQEKIEKLEQQSDLQKLEYQMHEYFKETELQKQLPVPRLEMRFFRLKNHRSDDNWYNVCWKYGIVYKHYAETHNDTMLFIPLSQTTSNGGDGTFNSHFQDGRLDTPFRDGVHIFADSKLFNLPAFIICEEKNISQKIELNMDISQQLSKMVRS
jgi:hypothetical protein